MHFREWLVEEGSRELARAYSDSLKDVPESPEHHPEGTTLKHVKLVRRAVSAAADQLQRLKSSPIFDEILAEVDFDLSEDDLRVLNMAAWLHDIGKASATTIGGTPFRDAASPAGKIQAIGHETPAHYGPQIDRLLSVAPTSTAEFYTSNRELLNFLIERHMDFAHGGFPSRLIPSFFDNGRLKNERPIRLLLVLMWADKIGRAKDPNLSKNEARLKEASDKSRAAAARAERKSAPFVGGEAEFRDMLRSRGLDQDSIESAVRSKFAKPQS
jgi:hypothetical protein